MTRSRARITGAVYLLYFVTVILATYLTGRVGIVFSDAANLIANLVYVGVTLLLYRIFAPVNRTLALVAVGISVAGCVVQSLSLFHLVPPQSALPVFGLFNISIGYLIVKSTFLPRALGVLMAASGVGWLLFLSPEVIRHTLVYVEITGITAEGCLMLWLLTMGIDARRWHEQAESV
jgi:hypothetical protein